MRHRLQHEGQRGDGEDGRADDELHRGAHDFGLPLIEQRRPRPTAQPHERRIFDGGAAAGEKRYRPMRRSKATGTERQQQGRALERRAVATKSAVTADHEFHDFVVALARFTIMPRISRRSTASSACEPASDSFWQTRQRNSEEMATRRFSAGSACATGAASLACSGQARVHLLFFIQFLTIIGNLNKRF